MGAADTAEAPGLNAPERIDRALTHQILRGTFPPGTHLPTLRDLAEAHGVNPSTMQRALARLERRGLITARQGSGLLVNDPAEVGDLSLVADWLAITAHDPERCASILADLLEARRVLATRLIVRHRLAVMDAVADLVAGASELLAASPDLIVEADLRVARTIIRATGNTVAAAILNSVERTLTEVPHLAEAMYGDPGRNAAALLEVVAAVRDGGPELGPRIEAVMEDIDAGTVSAFHRLLAENEG